MEKIESEVAAGRNAIACRELNELLSWNGDSNGGIAYLLGSCELARGRIGAAGQAWARVAPGSAFWDKAIRGRLRLLQQSGQYANAERLVKETALDDRTDRTAVLVLLVPIFTELGRIRDAARLIEDHWERLNTLGEGAFEPAINLILAHIELTWHDSSIENVRAVLNEAARRNPDDDRLWLGRANLAIRIGSYDEAEHWLDLCERSGTDDVPVQRARLNWGLAANRLDVVQHALERLPAVEASLAEIDRLKVWIAAYRHDLAAERRALERLLQTDPADLKALDRLAQLVEQSGRRAQAALLRRQRAEIDRLRHRYEKLWRRKQPIRDSVEMAYLADRLGSRFEARAFLTLAVWADPAREDIRRDLARLAPLPAQSTQKTRTLAEVVADDPANYKTPATQWHSPVDRGEQTDKVPAH
jgi:tetratricopeptide (TPR) repeat protein